jgi:hypothetical protein
LSGTAGDTVTILAPYTDVDAGDAFLPAIELMREYGITSGCGGTTYCPTDKITRGQMAVFMVRSILGGDTFTYNTTPYFTDVPGNNTYFQWVQMMKDLQITTGCGGTKYCGDDPVTRGQMAVFIIRARYGATTAFNSPTDPMFSDVAGNNIFYAWIQKMGQVGITSGCGGGKYCPDEPVTREQMAVFLMRGAFNQLLPVGAPVVTGVTPGVGTRGQTLTVTLTGQNTNFVNGVTQVSGGAGITVGNVSVSNGTTLTAQLIIDSGTAVGPRSLIVTTGSEEATIVNLFQVQ